MPIDNEKFATLARQGDVAGIAIEAVIALTRVRDVLQSLKAGGGITDEMIEEINASISGFNKRFDDLTGWTPE